MKAPHQRLRDEPGLSQAFDAEAESLGEHDMDALKAKMVKQAVGGSAPVGGKSLFGVTFLATAAAAAAIICMVMLPGAGPLEDHQREEIVAQVSASIERFGSMFGTPEASTSESVDPVVEAPAAVAADSDPEPEPEPERPTADVLGDTAMPESAVAGSHLEALRGLQAEGRHAEVLELARTLNQNPAYADSYEQIAQIRRAALASLGRCGEAGQTMDSEGAPLPPIPGCDPK